MIISIWDIIIRLLITAALGALIGYERERQSQPAGLRTHVILAVGACLAMIISINVAGQARELGFQGDPARIAAQVVSGIGFLGAGAILRYGTNIRGLTTATSLWTLAITGMTIGAGHLVAAGATALILFVSLTLLDRFEKRYIHSYKVIPLVLTVAYRPETLDEVRRLLKQHCLEITETTLERNLQSDVIVIAMTVKTQENAPVDAMIASLTELEGLRSFKVN